MLFAFEQVYLAIHQVGDTPADLSSVSMQIISRNSVLIGAEGPAIFGGACASKAISVAAIDVVRLTADVAEERLERH